MVITKNLSDYAFILMLCLLNSRLTLAENRLDLQHFGAKVLCQTPKLNWQEIWQSGIFDAQISVTVVKTSDRSPLTSAELASVEMFGRSGAKVNCSPEKVILIGTVAPKPWEGRVSNASQWCRATAVHVTHRAGGRSVPFQKELDGTGSVTCWPLDKELGPELWYLFPVGLGPLPTVPSENSLALGLTTWVQDIRNRHKLSRLEPIELHAETVAKISTGGLAHRRPVLKALKRDLEKRGLNLTGEDRVKGATLAEKAWLLWNSPRHRDLLLAPNARYLSVIDRGDLTVLILAQDLQSSR